MSAPLPAKKTAGIIKNKTDERRTSNVQHRTSNECILPVLKKISRSDSIIFKEPLKKFAVDLDSRLSFEIILEITKLALASVEDGVIFLQTFNLFSSTTRLRVRKPSKFKKVTRRSRSTQISFCYHVCYAI